MEQTTDTPSDGPAVTEPPRRRLTRRSSDRMIGGVASGLADYFDVDPWVVRALFVVLTFTGATGIVLYILGVIALLREDDAPGDSLFERASERFRGQDWLLWVLLGAAAIIAISSSISSPPFAIPLLLIGAGVFLLRDHRRPQPAAHAATADGATTEMPTAPTITTNAYGRGPRPREYRTRARRRKEPSSLKLLTFGLALISVPLTLALTHSNVMDLHVQQVIGVPITVLGIGILVSSWYGRAKGLTFFAILLLPFAVAASLANVPLSSSTGLQDYRPADATQLNNTYSLGAGKLIVDLSKVQVTDARTVDIHSGAGMIVVVTPQNSNTKVDASAGAGVLDILGHNTDGTSPRLTESTNGQGPELNLKVRTGFGRVLVTSNPNAPEAKR